MYTDVYKARPHPDGGRVRVVYEEYPEWDIDGVGYDETRHSCYCFLYEAQCPDCGHWRIEDSVGMYWVDIYTEDEDETFAEAFAHFA